jgi:hypothetical protein
MRLVKNPFSTAQPVSKKLKICFFGPSGSGKTVSALTFPRVALIDAEGGSDMYAGRPGIAPFSILRTKSIQELREAISYIRTDNGRSFDTLVIDPITVFYDVQKEALSRASRTGDMTVREWTRVNGAMKAVYAELCQLPVHVVVIAREATEYETVNGELRRTGVKADADKALSYVFDFVLRFSPDHTATVIKSRGAALGEQQRLSVVHWQVFEEMALACSQGETIRVQSEDDAVESAALAEEFQDRDIVTRFFEAWHAHGLATRDILAALGVTRASEWRYGLAAADEAVNAYHSRTSRRVASAR